VAASGVLSPTNSPEEVLTWIAGASLQDTSELAARVFRREGDYWTISYAGVTVRLRDVKGLGHLAHLLRHPGHVVHVTELIGRSSRREDRAATERARVAATKAITIALARISACHPVLGAHLAATIRRGYSRPTGRWPLPFPSQAPVSVVRTGARPATAWARGLAEQRPRAGGACRPRPLGAPRCVG
jgi:hypothetical protein